MKHLSLFTGYGGFDLACQKHGIETVGFSEIEKNACALLKYRFPNIKNYEDITKINPKDLPDFDLLTAGFPCQSYSIAGKRGGLEDFRGQLIYDVFRILKEKKPKWFLLENVKGFLNHDSGKSSSVIFMTLRSLGYAVDEKVLNTKEFGLPQNRERVFIVGLREDLCGILPDFWHFLFPIPPKTPCRLSDILENEVDEKYYLSEKAVKRLLNSNGGFKSKVNPEIGSCLFSSMHKISRGMDLIELTKNQSQGYRVYSPDGVSSTLAGEAGGMGAKTGLYMINDSSRKKGIVDKNISPTIRIESHGALPCVAIPVLTPDRPEKRQNGRRFKDDGDPTFILTAQDKHGIYNGSRIRKLAPTECARLQGLKDDWLDFGINEKGEAYKLSDSAKYRLAGNGVSVPVVEAIIRSLLAYHI